MTTTWYQKYVLLWAVLCLVAQQAMGRDYFSPDMAKSQKYLNTYLKQKSKTDLPVGALFDQMMGNTLQEPVRLLLASETLKVYVSILDNMMEKTKDETANHSLDMLKSKMEELRKAYFEDHQKQLEALTNELRELQAMNIQDELVQRKAIYEIKMVYNRASSLGEARSILRRRRQTRRPVIPRP